MRLPLLGRVALLTAPIRCFGQASRSLADEGCHAAYPSSAVLLQQQPHSAQKEVRNRIHSTFATVQTDEPAQLAADGQAEVAEDRKMTWKWRGFVLACGLAVLSSLTACYYFSQQGCSQDPVNIDNPNETSSLLCKETRLQKATGPPTQVLVISSISLISYAASVVLYIMSGKASKDGVPYGVALSVWRSFCITGMSGFLSFSVCWLFLGVSVEDMKTIRSPRNAWTRETIQRLEGKYGERAIKVCDAISRRMVHVLTHTVNYSLLVPFAIPDQPARVLAMMIFTILNLLIKLAVFNADGIIGCILWGSARVRDGSLARWNVLSGRIVTCGYMPLTMVILLDSKILPAHAPYILSYVWQPTIWGDTFAEIVGSFCGRLEFRVYGLGEINKKTFEGVLGCWIASFIGCILVSRLQGFPSQSFIMGVPALSCLLASAGTLMETVSFRGTDNASMVLSCLMLVMFCYVAPSNGIA